MKLDIYQQLAIAALAGYALAGIWWLIEWWQKRQKR